MWLTMLLLLLLALAPAAEAGPLFELELTPLWIQDCGGSGCTFTPLTPQPRTIGRLDITTALTGRQQVDALDKAGGLFGNPPPLIQGQFDFFAVGLMEHLTGTIFDVAGTDRLFSFERLHPSILAQPIGFPGLVWANPLPPDCTVSPGTCDNRWVLADVAPHQADRRIVFGSYTFTLVPGPGAAVAHPQTLVLCVAGCALALWWAR